MSFWAGNKKNSNYIPAEQAPKKKNYDRIDIIGQGIHNVANQKDNAAEDKRPKI